MTDLSVAIGSLKLANPVLTASGTFGYGDEFKDFFDLNLLGGVVTKTVTMEFRPGNPPPRIVETAAGMLNSIGLPNLGVEGFIREKWPFLQTLKTNVIVNVAGKVGDDFVRVVERMEAVPDIAAYELNFSCPNVKEGGLSFSANAETARKVTQAVRQVTRRPMIVKLTPNVTSIAEIGLAVQEGGADAVSAINTLVGMAVDVQTRKPRLATITGGLSGPAIKPIALAKVYELVKVLKIPVIAIGGILTAQDALEFLLVGAVAVQIGTANFMQPDAPVAVLRGIAEYCEKNSIASIRDLIGKMVIG
jgi:dihydroorotate dehydrogenase (NAD+) catalytic subunit